ncbi:hypothetical protein [Streptomyces sp. enrichment culture]|uniref:hypothetical protein n=1 Tax=Streptomyces sp. enrichment culture TaxID=1795815 RepID=UPI003F554C05
MSDVTIRTTRSETRDRLASVAEAETTSLRAGLDGRLVEPTQYTSQRFTALATELGARLSADRTGQCWYKWH